MRYCKNKDSKKEFGRSGMNRGEFDCPHWAHRHKQMALQQE
jgi:hypothetical protein